MKSITTVRMSHSPVTTNQGIGQIRSEQCSFSLEAVSFLAIENSGRRNISFDPMPGQGGNPLRVTRAAPLGFCRQQALPACPLLDGQSLGEPPE